MCCKRIEFHKVDSLMPEINMTIKPFMRFLTTQVNK